MDVKRDRLLPAAMSDSLLAILAAGVVALLVALHSRSFAYAIAVFFVLGLSVVGSLAFYSLFTSDFPLLNLVIFVLLIAVGTDDAFLLFSHFPQNLKEESFYECMAHTSSTMFLTSFSTAVPFFVNISSNVVVFRCFGLFAGVTILINFFLVISFLPAFLILQKRYFVWMLLGSSEHDYLRFLSLSLMDGLWEDVLGDLLSPSTNDAGYNCPLERSCRLSLTITTPTYREKKEYFMDHRDYG
ncbi:hypothetical protein COOONC_27924 [Cooperia oncophora]